MAESPSLNKWNYLNLTFYIFNTAFTYGQGNLAWFGGGTNSELSDKYQTLVTPNSSAFSIWSLIFTAQLIFVIAQMFPKFRGKAMVQDGVKFYYILTCIFQVAWTFVFSFEVIWLSVIFILSIWGSLVALLYSQYYTPSEGTLVEFWLLRFPFAIHCGWLTAASALNVNVLVVSIGPEPAAPTQLAVGIVSLAVLHAVSVWVLFGFKRPNYTIAGVLAWANGWIYAELQQPRSQVVDLFHEDIISGVSYAALAVTFIISLQIAVRAPHDIYVRCFKKKNTDGSKTSTSEYSDGEV